MGQLRTGVGGVDPSCCVPELPAPRAVLVRVAGLEPATSWIPTRYAAILRHTLMSPRPALRPLEALRRGAGGAPSYLLGDESG